jgi:hypothetical protein
MSGEKTMRGEETRSVGKQSVQRKEGWEWEEKRWWEYTSWTEGMKGVVVVLPPVLCEAPRGSKLLLGMMRRSERRCERGWGRLRCR